MVFAYPPKEPKLPTIEELPRRSSTDSAETLTNAPAGPFRSLSWGFANPRKQHVLKIVLACSLIILPMIAFTIALLWIVFVNLVNQTPCPYPELCPGPELLNTTGGGYYYVDFSATRLAFLASLSSSISFSLVTVIMSIYAYSIARDLLYSSTSIHRDQLLPSPYQMSVLIRLLNSELLMLWEIFWRKFEEVFWKRERGNDEEKPNPLQFPHIVRVSVTFFIFSLLASMYIQAADTYLHLSTEAVNIIEVLPQSPATQQFSRGLNDWCLNRPTVGSPNNKNFFSCSLIQEAEEGVGDVTYLANSSSIVAIDNQVSPHHEIYSFDNPDDGDTYAVVAPARMNSDIDWKASSFGVSTQCSPIPAGGCDLKNATVEGGAIFWEIVCTKNVTGLDFAGNITQQTTQHAYLDFHKYLSEQGAFNSQNYVGWAESASLVPTITDEESNEVFANPWHWVHVLKYADDVEHRTEEYLNDAFIQRSPALQDFVLLACNTTVWDVTYSVVGGKISDLEKKKSNGSIAGISSMATSRVPNFMAPSFAKAYYTANFKQTSPSSFINFWKASISRTMALPIGAQTSPRPSEFVQRRVAKVVTRLPVSSVWILASANAIFAILGLVLGFVALKSGSQDAFQIHTRLGVAGLAAALFETKHSEMNARDDSKLFEENASETKGVKKRVGVKLTHTGGAGFVLNKT